MRTKKSRRETENFAFYGTKSQKLKNETEKNETATRVTTVAVPSRGGYTVTVTDTRVPVNHLLTPLSSTTVKPGWRGDRKAHLYFFGFCYYH